jgi:HK97 family phage prohead protease
LKNRKYDFAGWVTKNDIKCSDGVTIKQSAFKDNDGQKVPLIWNHNYNSPENVLGHMILKHQDGGVYGYGYFNESEDGQKAKQLVKHGDISSMSIGARKIKRSGTDVIHGLIYEVSLVLAAANPGAMIESVMAHGEDGEEKAIIFPGTLIHSADDIIEHEDKKDDDDIQHEDKTIEQIIDTMNDEQREAVEALLGLVADGNVQGEEKTEEKDDEGAGEAMKHNVFDKEKQNDQSQLKHSINETLSQAVAGKVSSLKDLFKASDDETLKHGINSIEMLFPEAMTSTNGNTPIIYKDPNTAYKEILNGVTKSPFSRVRTLVADLTEDEARAKGYIKGNMKKEEFFSLIKRVTTPTTVYKKQKLDRDDIIDITDFDVVAFMNMEMRMMLEEELARAILVGDGRDVGAEDKINEQNIRPIITDNDFFTIKKAYAAVDKFEEAIITAMSEYRGSGLPTMYIDPTLLAAIKLLKGTDGRYLTGSIPTDAELATRYGLRAIQPTTFMVGKGALVVNLSDYNLGATKGGQITNFDDFDIDFNQYKYLIETRLSGALTMPKSAIHLAPTTAGTGANDTAAGITKGQREADKLGG